MRKLPTFPFCEDVEPCPVSVPCSMCLHLRCSLLFSPSDPLEEESLHFPRRMISLLLDLVNQAKSPTPPSVLWIVLRSCGSAVSLGLLPPQGGVSTPLSRKAVLFWLGSLLPQDGDSRSLSFTGFLFEGFEGRERPPATQFFLLPPLSPLSPLRSRIGLR